MISLWEGFLVDEITRTRLLDSAWPVSKAVRRQAQRIDWQNINEYGYDELGFHPPTAMVAASAVELLYRHYFRVEAKGTERVPATGRVLLYGNHSGQLPLDGAMVAASQFFDRETPRIVRTLVEYWFPTLPFVGTYLNRAGQVTGLPGNATRMLEREECVAVFPEGIRGSGKLFKDRYRLLRFGTGFVRLALQTGTPLVPVAIVGGEEQAPSLYDVKPLAKALGFPYFPLTPFFPWLGLLGAIPLPTKYRLEFGEPISLEGHGDEPDEIIAGHVEMLRNELASLLGKLLAERKHVFW
jgi:1-acyl-sn-glycerol-3-phosphate acyltransferase